MLVFNFRLTNAPYACTCYVRTQGKSPQRYDFFLKYATKCLKNNNNFTFLSEKA